MSQESTGQEPLSLSNSPEFLALNQKQRRFVFAYLKSGNATQSYKDAGYNCHGPSSEAASSRLLTNGKIQAAMRLAQGITNAIAEQEFQMSRKERLGILSKIARSNLKKVVSMRGGSVEILDSDQISDDDFLTIKSISYSSSEGKEGSSRSLSVATHDRIKAIELISKLSGDLNGDGRDDNRSANGEALKARIHGLRSRVVGLGRRSGL